MKFMLSKPSRTQIPDTAINESDGWYVEIDSLEELIEFQNNLVAEPGNPYRWEGIPGLIIWLDFKESNGLPLIEVYDGYRE